MPHSRQTSASVSSGSLMQDVPGSFPQFPGRTSTEEYSREDTTGLSLSAAVHARRSEYLRPKHVRIKIGTWNVAAHKGAEKDIGGWFVEGRGLSKTLSGLTVSDDGDAIELTQSKLSETESIVSQESRFVKKQTTLPQDDPGGLPGDENVGLYVLALQEVVDITSIVESVRPYTDSAVAQRWKDELEKALPLGYQLVAEQQLIGLLLLIYASADIANEVRSVSTTSVGTGLGGYMGNKGAVTARIVVGDTTRLVFVNCHLAAGADKTAAERRNWDASQIVQRTRFEPIKDAMDLTQSTGEQIGDEDFAFWAGDLNYRLETIPGEDVRRLLMLHTRNEYDLSRPRSGHQIDKEIEVATEISKANRQHAGSIGSAGSSNVASPRPSSETARTETASTSPTLVDEIHPDEDPTSLQTTVSSLLSHDELTKQIKARKAFYDGWREAPIRFLPTYKYDVGSVGVFDSSEKKRAPSWCDRILYRTRRDKLSYDAKIKAEEAAKKRDEEMEANGTDHGADEEEILYDYDPDTDGADPNDDYNDYDEYNDADDGIYKVTTAEGVEDELRTEYYTSHQRVLSSDHKPLNAIFSLRYEAVVPELKAKVHAEVAKDFDQAENEGRPNVTVVVDQHNEKSGEPRHESIKGFEGVSFGDVRWNQTKIQTLTIANTSRVPATFSFIERPSEPDQIAGIAPMWLIVRLNGATFPSSTNSTAPTNLEPGDTASVELEVHVSDRQLVRDLNEEVVKLDDVLVLRVEGGRDHFIPVKAKWLDTSLGRSIDKLIRIPEGGIRKLQNQRPDKGKSKHNNQSQTSSRSATPAAAEEPVRFSAPRELFRLTEAIEELGTRVLAEWDMISSDSDIAPWLRNSGWPFASDCWTGNTQSWWNDALSEICNSLDEDQALDGCLQPDMPRMQRLYVLCNFLVIFMDSIPDGIIDEKIWLQMDDYLTSLDKSKHKPSIEEQRTAIQEILSQSPSNSISFILLMTMIDRLLQEIGGAYQASKEPPTSPTTKKAGTLRRITGSFGGAHETSHRDQARSALSRTFSAVMFKSSAAGSKKHSATQDKRKAEVLEIFLKRDDAE